MTTCIIPGDNHSHDQIHMYTGSSYSIPVCGFHEQKHSGKDQTIYKLARLEAENESQWIVYTEDRDGVITATIKKSALAARRMYNKITGDYKTYGFARVNDAYPNERVAAGFRPIPLIHVPM